MLIKINLLLIEQAFTDFIRSDAFRDVTSWGKEQILSARPQHKIYKQ